MQLRLTLFFWLCFGTGPLLFAQGVQVDRQITFVSKEVGEICTLDPTDVNAFFFRESKTRADKLPAGAALADFQITYNNDCGESTWPAAAQTAMEYAADIWSAHLDSDVPIRIHATWVEQEGNVLGSAGPGGYFTLTGGGIPNTVYTIAQASAMTGQDLVNEYDIPADIEININCSYEDWYFGTDASPPAGQIDFVTVAMHEIGHGVGFLGSVGGNASSRQAGWGYQSNDGTVIPGIFDLFAIDGFFNQIIDDRVYTNYSRQLYDGVTGLNGGLFFDGPEAEIVTPGHRVPLYAPSIYQSGSSFSHLDQATFTGTDNALMRPQIDMAFAIHDPGPVFCGLLEDMEWPLGSGCRDQLADSNLLRKPVLTGPGNNFDELPTDQRFSWEPVAQAGSYEIQIASDFGFEDVLIDQSVPSTEFSPEGPLSLSGIFYWRVRALNHSTQSQWSNTWSFSTVSERPPPVSLQSPNDGAEHLRPGFMLSWEPAEGAWEYRLEVSESSDFAAPVIERSLNNTRFSQTGDLDLYTTYYWRVRGENGGGDGEWSEIWSFRTIIERPDMVNLSAPSAGQVQVPAVPTFTWNRSERASEYVLQLSPDENFTGEFIETTLADTLYESEQTLDNAEIYFWRVKAVNIGGESEWSIPRQFTTRVLETKMASNYPNPFNNETTLRYQLSEASNVRIDLFDITGRRVSVLVEEPRQPGVYFEQINGSNLASGTYLIRFVTEEQMDVQKMSLVK